MPALIGVSAGSVTENRPSWYSEMRHDENTGAAGRDSYTKRPGQNPNVIKLR